MITFVLPTLAAPRRFFADGFEEVVGVLKV